MTAQIEKEMPASAFSLLYIPTPSLNVATALGKILLEQRLVACVNILPTMLSLYHWEGKLQQEEEVLLLAKTLQNKFIAVQALLEKHHPYRCPCIISLPWQEGNGAFLQWVEQSVS